MTNYAPQFKDKTLDQLRAMRRTYAERTGVLADPIMLNIIEGEIACREKGALPPDPEGMNTQRAEYAAEVIRFFEDHGGESAPTSTERYNLNEQNLSDLLCDFAHYCDRYGVEMVSVIRRAMNHYSAETDNEGTQFFGLAIE